MAFTDINSFLPAYPSIDIRDDNLFDLFPKGFYGSLYNKKEFNQLQPDLTKPRIVDGKFHAQPQQIYSSRYSSYRTLYDNQIIIHSMGLGKTALAVLTVENNLENGFTGALIAVPSGKFIRSFITEIVNITGTKYYPDKYDEFTNAELKRAIEARIKKVYSFITFKAFANSVEKDKATGGINFTVKRLHDEYSNRVMIVDEAHNLRIQPDKKAETSQVNSAFHMLFHSVENCKILLMTATPMKDRWNEIADLANLVLPRDKQLPSGDDFDQKFGNDGINIESEDFLKDRLKGLISTLRTVPSTIKRDFIGEFIAGLKIFKVDVCKMSEHQSRSYARALEYDRTGIKKGVYSDSLQAINFVFPDGSYGPAGFKKYTIPVTRPSEAILKAGRKSLASSQNRSFDIPSLTQELRDSIRSKNDSDEDALQKLSIYSKKYAKTIETIIDQTKRKGGNTFIYNTFVDGSGLIIFARILELFGYSRSVRGIENTPGKRYVLLTNDTLDEGNIIADVQKTMNDPKNARGEYIQVVLGSRTAGEGLSFYNVENIGIHTPYWNYSPTDQAIGRGIRYRSHEEIEKIYAQEGKEFKVNIHHYVSVPFDDDPEESIDVMMYKTSEDKDIRIKRGERFLKQISYDCANNRLVNMKGVDGSRECEYLSCDYKCEGIDDSLPKNIDHSSFNNYYSDDEVEKIIQIVKKTYRTIFSLTLTELFNILADYEHFIIIKALKKIVDQSIVIINQFGFKNYLREHNDVYFLMDSMESPSSSLASYYTNNPAIKSVISFSDYVKNVQFNKSANFLDYMYEASQNDNFKEVLNFWNRLPLNVQEALLEVTIDAQESKVSNNIKFRDWLLDLNKASIFYLNDGKIVSTLNEELFRCRNLEGEWNDCIEDEKIQEFIESKKKEAVVSLEENPYGYYAIVNEVLLRGPNGWKKGFWIRDVSKAKQVKGGDMRKIIRGEQCATGTLKVGKLATMALKFGLDFQNNKDSTNTLQTIKTILKKDVGIQESNINIDELSEQDIRRLYRLAKGGGRSICEILLKWFKEKNLVQVTTKIEMK